MKKTSRLFHQCGCFDCLLRSQIPYFNGLLSLTSVSLSEILPISTGLCGQVSSGCFRKGGPCDQRSFLNSASTIIPLDASLAGFSDVSTYRYWVAVDWSNIAETRFVTKI